MRVSTARVAGALWAVLAIAAGSAGLGQANPDARGLWLAALVIGGASALAGTGLAGRRPLVAGALFVVSLVLPVSYFWPSYLVCFVAIGATLAEAAGRRSPRSAPSESAS